VSMCVDFSQGSIVFIMILLQQNKRRREPGKKCHARTMMHSKSVKLQHNAHHVSLSQTVAELRPKID
jgi:chorismate mutase